MKSFYQASDLGRYRGRGSQGRKESKHIKTVLGKIVLGKMASSGIELNR